MESITKAIQNGGNAILMVTSEQLKDFAEYVMREWGERTAQEALKAREHTRLSQDEVCEYLHKSKATIWRWAKIGYLKPAGYVGDRPFYYQSQLDELGKEAV